METPAIRHALRGKLNSLQLSVALLPVVEPDEALVYLEHIRKQCERIVELIDELNAREVAGPEMTIPAPLLDPAAPDYRPPPTA
jgi:signal transduction histidine kinase